MTSDDFTPQEQAEIEAFFQEVIARSGRHACVQCGTPLTAKEQVGRCIYAEPCGCRQGQGRLTDTQGRRVERLTYEETP